MLTGARSQADLSLRMLAFTGILLVLIYRRVCTENVQFLVFQGIRLNLSTELFCL